MHATYDKRGADVLVSRKMFAQEVTKCVLCGLMFCHLFQPGIFWALLTVLRMYLQMSINPQEGRTQIVVNGRILGPKYLWLQGQSYFSFVLYFLLCGLNINGIWYTIEYIYNFKDAQVWYSSFGPRGAKNAFYSGFACLGPSLVFSSNLNHFK